MTRKLKITPGKWFVVHKADPNEDGAQPIWIDSDAHIGIAKIELCDLSEDGSGPEVLTDEDRANAELIAEAGTVANECGLMPRELLTQRDELLALVAKAAQLAEVADDWDLQEVQVDGEMVYTFDLRREFKAAIARVRGEP